MLHSNEFFLLIASFIAGIINGISGGGGLILLGVLLLVGVPPQTAIGTNKFIATIGYMSAIYNFVIKDKIRWDLLFYGVFPVFLGAIAGARLAAVIDEQTFGKFISFLFPLAIFFAFYIPSVSDSESLNNDNNLTNGGRFFILPAICLVVGFYNGIFGPGTITILVICFYYFLNIDIVKGLAVAGILNWISNIGAVITFNYSDDLMLSLGILLSVTNMLGCYIGSNMVILQGSILVKRFLVLTLSISFFYIIIEYWL